MTKKRIDRHLILLSAIKIKLRGIEETRKKGKRPLVVTNFFNYKLKKHGLLLIVFDLWSTIFHLCKMEIKFKIGQRIRFLRERASMSQKDLAYTADLDRSYIASVESGFHYEYRANS